MWAPQVEALRARWRVVVPDIRGLGRSEAGDGQHTLEHLVDDLLALLDALAVERAVLCGLSMGGAITMFLGALCQEFSAVCISGWLCSFRYLMLERAAGCNCYIIPGIWNACEIPDIMGLIAPRPLVIESGLEDACIDLQAAKDAYREVKAIYESCDAADHLVKVGRGDGVDTVAGQLRELHHVPGDLRVGGYLLCRHHGPALLIGPGLRFLLERGCEQVDCGAYDEGHEQIGRAHV